jgi:AcrR family transcriptional regulator
MSSDTGVTATSRPIAPKAGSEPEPPADAKPMRKDALRNRQALIDAARVVFAQRGVEASLDDIARQAGVGVGTAYRHFANKYDLLAALMEQILDGVLDTAESTLAIDDPWLALVSFLEQMLQMQVNDRGLREVMLGFHDEAQFDQKFEQVHDRIGAVVDDLLERAKTAGVVRIDAETSDIGVIVMMLCAAADLTSDDAPDLWRRYLALCLEGLKPADVPLPEQALSEQQMRAALAVHKGSLSRSSC